MYSSRHLFKANNYNTRATCEICSKLTTKAPEQHQWTSSSDNVLLTFEQTSQCSDSIVDFQQVSATWDSTSVAHGEGCILGFISLGLESSN